MMETLTLHPRVRHAQVALAVVGLLLAIASLASETMGICGSCGDGNGIHIGIGAAGTLGYLGLAIAALAGFESLFQIGVLAVAAVHTALATWMVTIGGLCPICIAAALAAFANAAVGLATSRTPFALLERTFLPTLLVASGVVFAVVVHEGRDQAERVTSARRDLAATAPPTLASRGSAIRLLVYENDNCGYCQEFRDGYAPLLARDFGSRVAVEFREAVSASWVRRTPTIAIEAGTVFEGLPLRYEDLRSAVEAALGAATGGSNP